MLVVKSEMNMDTIQGPKLKPAKQQLLVKCVSIDNSTHQRRV